MPQPARYDPYLDISLPPAAMGGNPPTTAPYGWQYEWPSGAGTPPPGFYGAAAPTPTPPPPPPVNWWGAGPPGMAFPTPAATPYPTTTGPQVYLPTSPRNTVSAAPDLTFVPGTYAPAPDYEWPGYVDPALFPPGEVAAAPATAAPTTEAPAAAGPAEDRSWILNPPGAGPLSPADRARVQARFGVTGRGWGGWGEPAGFFGVPGQRPIGSFTAPPFLTFGGGVPGTFGTGVVAPGAASIPLPGGGGAFGATGGTLGGLGASIANRALMQEMMFGPKTAAQWGGMQHFYEPLTGLASSFIYSRWNPATGSFENYRNPVDTSYANYLAGYNWAKAHYAPSGGGAPAGGPGTELGPGSRPISTK
jgi:hypothetical protein